jgi:hypothetical protein
LHAPESWRRYDPELFDALRDAVLVNRRRAVSVCGERRLLPEARFHESELSDCLADGGRYFQQLDSAANGMDLVFFDPDNGLEVSSCRRGARGSSKYLFWSELEATFARGHSVLVYQHFPRVPREGFTQRIAERIATGVSAASVHSFATSRVLFLLVPQARHASVLHERTLHAARQWTGQILHQQHAVAHVDENTDYDANY